MGGFRFRKSYKIAPGVKFNVGKKGVGVSVGGKYLRKSINTSGRQTTTIGTPVSGLYYTETQSSKSPSSKQISAKKVKAKPTTNQIVQNVTEPEQGQPNGMSKKKKVVGISVLLLVFALVLGGLFGDSTSEEKNADPTEITTAVERLSSNDTVQKDDGLWVVADGMLMADRNGVVESDAGNWYYVKDGKVQTDFTGAETNDYGTWFIRDGKVDFGANGLLETGLGWLYFVNGKVDRGYEGIQQNQYGTWYVREGQAQLDYNGTVDVNGQSYSVNKGKATLIQATTAPATYSSYNSGTQNAASYDDSEDYIGNSGTYKFHQVGCRAINDMKPENIVTGHSKGWYLENGYEPSGICHP